MDLTALDRRGSSKGSADRLGQCLGTVDDEEPGRRRVQPALDEIVDERLHGRGVLRRTLGEAERMLVALRVDTDRRDQDQISVHAGWADIAAWEIGFIWPSRSEWPFKPGGAGGGPDSRGG